MPNATVPSVKVLVPSVEARSVAADGIAVAGCCEPQPPRSPALSNASLIEGRAGIDPLALAPHHAGAQGHVDSEKAEPQTAQHRVAHLSHVLEETGCHWNAGVTAE